MQDKIRSLGVIGMLAIFLAGSVSGGVIGSYLAMSPTGQRIFGTETSGKASVVNERIPTYDEAHAEEAQTIAVAKSAAPAVVSIVISKEISRATTFPFNMGDVFGIPMQQQGTGQKEEVGGGTGFIVKSDGLIVTNKHVVSDEKADYTVVTNDGKRYPAKVLGRDPVVDIAVIKIEATNLPTLSFGNSDEIRIGQTVIAIGNALAEFQNTVTKGVVSGMNRRVIAGNPGFQEVLEEAIQTDTAINRGNSGGPLLDLNGNVIGVNTAVSENGQLIGFAIPGNVARRTVDSIEKYGEIVRPYLGVRYVLLEQRPELAKALGVSDGALILSGAANDPAVVKDSPAEKAGLKERDIIVKVAGIPVNGEHSLASILSRYQAGDSVELTVRRGDQEISIKVTLGRFPEPVKK